MDAKYAMTDHHQKRIAIAEAMGWTRAENGIAVWNRPGTKTSDGMTQFAVHELPDPLNSDADAMAVVEWLWGRGNSISLMFGVEGAVAVLNQHSCTAPKDNYREGIVELAWRVIDD